MKKLRQRLVDLQPHDIEQLCALVDGLSLEAISALVRTEGDLRQSVQALFPHYASWAFNPPAQNPRSEEDITTQDAINMNALAHQLEGNFVSRQANAQQTEAGNTNNCPIPCQVQQSGTVVIIDEFAESSQHLNPGAPTPRPPTVPPPTLWPLIGSVPTTIVYTPETLELLAPGEDLDVAAEEAMANLE